MTLRTMQPSFTAGELSPALYARVDMAKYASGLKVARNLFIHPHGGASNRAGMEFIAAINNQAQRAVLIPFAFNTEQTYVLEFGEGYIRFFTGGAQILSGGAPYQIATPYPQADLDDIRFVQDADVMYLTHVNHPIKKLARLGPTNWTLNNVTFAPSIAGPASVSAAVVQGTGGTLYQYKVSAVSAANGEESLPTGPATVLNDLTIAGNINRVTWPAATGAERYIVYREDNGVFGYIGGTQGLFFNDENITPDLSDTPQTGRNPFTGGNNPRVATFFEQRLVFASTKNDPQAVYLSQSANSENFGTSSPAKANDAITFRLKARQVNEIRAMVPGRALLLMTSDTEWSVTGENDGYLTPSNPVIRPQGYRGSSKVQPILVGNIVLFAQGRGGVVRDFGYQFSDDGYTGNDLTVLARHLFEGRTITSWAYAQAPYSIIWAVLDYKDLVSLTYLREHEVWAWTRHDTQGDVEHVVSVAEGDEDAVYLIVKRTFGGSVNRYVERLHSRDFADIRDAFFVDAGRSYNGLPVTSVSGMGHLLNQPVVALADGNVIRGLMVDGTGKVTLPNGQAASRIHIGLPYQSDLQTLSLDLGNMQGLGTVQGRRKTVAKVTMRVEKTRGIFVGPADDDLIEFKQRSTEAWNEAIGLLTGDCDIVIQPGWNREASIFIRQSDPLPMTILAVMPDVVIGT